MSPRTVVAPPYVLDNALLARAGANLAAFRRRPMAPDGRRLAAVAVVLLPGQDRRACFLLTRRASGLRTHSQQFALPGGRIEAGEGPERAALRELGEEVGLVPDEVSVLGLLDDYGTRSGFIITPVVVWAEPVSRLSPNPAEVARVYRVPLDDLEKPGVPGLTPGPEEGRPIIQLPLLSTFIFAPTAAIVYQMREVVLHARPTRVDHFDQPGWAWR